MAECACCGSTIVFGGKQHGEARFCSDRCLRSGVNSELQGEKRWGMVIEPYFGDESVLKRNRSVVALQATWFALAIAAACFVGWCLVLALFRERGAYNLTLSGMAVTALRLTWPVGLAAWFLGGMLYASRVRSAKSSRESPESRNDV